MAKKQHRIIVHLKCSKCGEQNYTTNVNKMNTPDKLGLNKFCSRCKSSNTHNQVNKLK